MEFTPSHRGGTGAPLVLIHGVTDTWRTWELVLPALERRFDVLAVTLRGHAGAPDLAKDADRGALADGVCEAMDEAGWDTAHIAGNSLGGYVSLQMAERGRARSVVALGPAGGWADEGWRESITHFRRVRELLEPAAPHIEAIVSTPEGRRRATAFTTVNYEHIPAELLAHQLHGVLGAHTERLLERGLALGWELDFARITCPVRVVWGTDDAILPWPATAARYRECLPQADWVVLDGVGHSPQLDVPLETAELIAGFP